MSLLHRVVRVLDDAAVRYALVGAVAVASRGAPRSTFDLDLLTTDKRALNEDLWSDLRKAGIPIDVRRGDFDDPLSGVIRIGRRPDQIDIVVGRWAWERAIIERAEPIQVRGISIPVPSRSDLILLKLAAGGPLDHQDAYRLLRIGPRDELVEDIDAKIRELPSHAQESWRRLLSETSSQS